MDDMIDSKAIEVFMKTQGFERMEDYCDNSGCPAPMTGGILQFYNPATKIGVQFCYGEGTDDIMFGEDFQIEVKEKWS